MSKAQITKQGENTVALLLRERNFLTELLSCPFVVRSYAATQSDKHLYLLLEFCQGGELDFHLQNMGRMPEDHVKFYAAEMIVALDAMHKRFHVVHRDIKPENVLLDQHGHVSVIDFNIASKCDEEGKIPNPSKKSIGTMPYMAPEMLDGKDHSTAVDWWSLGALLFELRNGELAFDNQAVDEKKFKEVVKKPEKVVEKSKGTSDFKELLTGLLTVDPDNRWSGEDCKKCKFFEGVDWDDVEQKKLKAPISPDQVRINFKADATVEEAFGMNKVKESKLTPEQQKAFEGWDWVNENQDIPEGLIDDIERKSKGKGK
eukprot:TRINITY_DN2282_c0_g1_i1.p1 TRINITY_DN2282_c0_g1~~TRINITY_DN2282_c0_g1_i1.p1  ORF type:complete len:316 (+),score=52.83 TRINITY_DN2282_c0_g1_i1:209-1156(+)